MFNELGVDFGTIEGLEGYVGIFFFFFLEKINRHIESRVNRACIDISHFI